MRNREEDCFESIARTLNGARIFRRESHGESQVAGNIIRLILDEGFELVLAFAGAEVAADAADKYVFVGAGLSGVINEVTKQKRVDLRVELGDLADDVAREFQKPSMKGSVLLRHANTNATVDRVELVSWIGWISKSEKRRGAVNPNG